MERILVAEDEVDMATMISEMLTLKGDYQVDTVHDGVAAIHQALNKSYDLFLLDVNMPRANDFEVCKKLKNREKN